MADIFTQLSTQTGIPLAVIVIGLVWSYVWKLIALWKSARLNQPVWFVILAVVNTLGILEILYIFLFTKIDLNEKSKAGKENKPNRKRRK